MTEEERVAIINQNAGKIVESLLEAFENRTLNEDEFLADTYARLVVASLMGFSPAALSEDSVAASERLLALSEEDNSTE